MSNFKNFSPVKRNQNVLDKKSKEAFYNKFKLYKHIQENKNHIIVENCLYSLKTSVLYSEKIPQQAKDELRVFFELAERNLADLTKFYDDK